MNNYGQIYKNVPIGKLLRLKTFFITCKFPFLVKNLGNIYNLSTRIVGSKITNRLIEYTYGDIFLAGETNEELEVSLNDLKKGGLLSIADYAREFLTEEEENSEMDVIIQKYKDSIDTSIRVDDRNSIAMKISSFGNVDMYKRLNSVQYVLCLIENEIMKGRNSKEVLQFLKDERIQHNFTHEIINYFGENLKGHFGLNFYEMLINKDKSEDTQKLLDAVSNGLFISLDDLNVIGDYAKTINNRLLTVFSHSLNKQCLIMIDAEQSYLRYISDYIVAYYFKKFNTNHCILSHTLQCYLRTQQGDLLKWNSFCRVNKLKFGLKLVRGAYMNEEARIAKEKGLISTVCDSVEETHSNYDKSIRYLFENFQTGDQFCIATHNLDSIKLVGELYKTKGRNESIVCAQLMGIAEHATGYCQQMEIKVAKYVPFGNFDILIPYLIRRAEESSMISKLKAQNDILNLEVLSRLKFWNKL